MIHFLQFRKKTIGTNKGKFSQGTVWMEKRRKTATFFFWKKSERTGKRMKAHLILEDGNVFTGTSIGSTKEVISEIVFNTSMTGYLEVLTDPVVCGTGGCYDLSADWKLWNHTGYGIRQTVAGWIYRKRVIKNAE